MRGDPAAYRAWLCFTGRAKADKRERDRMTTNTKWLPGPYEVAKRGTYPDDEGFKVLAPEQINSEGNPYRLYVAQFVKSEAEAKLFAAAPKLYTALLDLVAVTRSDVFGGAQQAALKQAREALAEARE